MFMNKFFTTIATSITIWLADLLFSGDKSPDNAARINVSRNAFSAQALKKNNFFDVDKCVVKNRSNVV